MVAPSLTAVNVLDQVGPFVEPAQAERAEVHIPFAVIDLDQADVFAAQRVADVDPASVPANPPVRADAAHRVVAGVLERRQVIREALLGRRVVRGRRRIGQGLVGSQGVVFRAPGIEAPLL